MRVLVLLPFLAAGLLTSCGFLEGKDTADKAVVLIHQQFNDEKYSDIYMAADADFRRATTLADLTQLFQAVHRKLGTFTSANQTNANVFSSTSGPTRGLPRRIQHQFADSHPQVADSTARSISSSVRKTPASKGSPAMCITRNPRIPHSSAHETARGESSMTQVRLGSDRVSMRIAR